jgi:Regulator of chromosome condensation (RCC1) repeat
VYRAWRDSIAVARSYVSIPRATGQPLPELALLGLTERAGESTAPYGVGVAVSICAGANHALLLHRTGQLYTWVSSSDKLFAIYQYSLCVLLLLMTYCCCSCRYF